MQHISFSRFEKGYCYLQKQCTFAHGNEERAYWIELYQRQVEYLTQLEKKQLVTEGFGEKVRRRMQHEDFVVRKILILIQFFTFFSKLSHNCMLDFGNWAIGYG